MLYRELISFFFQIRTEPIKTLNKQNVEMLNDNLSVHIVTTGLYVVKFLLYNPVS